MGESSAYHHPGFGASDNFLWCRKYLTGLNWYRRPPLKQGKSQKAHLEWNSRTVILISGHSLCFISAIVSHDWNIIGYSRLWGTDCSLSFFFLDLNSFVTSIGMIPQNLRITVGCLGFYQIFKIFLNLDTVFPSASKAAWSRIIFLSLKVISYLYIWYSTHFLQLHHIVKSCLICSPSPSGLPLHYCILKLMIKELALSKNNQLNQPLPRILRIQATQQNIPLLS